MTSRQARYSRMVRKARREAGLCPCCGGPPESGKKHCRKHLDYQRDLMRCRKSGR